MRRGNQLGKRRSDSTGKSNGNSISNSNRNSNNNNRNSRNNDRQFPSLYKGDVGQKKTGPRRKDDAHVIRRVPGSVDGFPEGLDPFRFGRREAVAQNACAVQNHCWWEEKE